MRAAAIGLIASALACAPRQVAERLVLNDRIVRTADVPFGTHERQRLDVYRSRRTRARAPVVVFIYGGRWKYSSKRDYLLIGNALARLGWVVVVPGYRLFPDVRFPAWVEDGASAVRWTRDNIARFGGDSTRIVVVGHSAGAHTVAMLALDEHFLRDAGVPANVMRGFVSIAGPVDTTWTAPDVQELMGPREGWAATYPANFVDGHEAPLLLLHGEGDSVVSVGNSRRLAARIHARDGCVRLVTYPKIGHVAIALALVSPSLVSAPVLRDVKAFVEDPVGNSCTEPAH